MILCIETLINDEKTTGSNSINLPQLYVHTYVQYPFVLQIVWSKCIFIAREKQSRLNQISYKKYFNKNGKKLKCRVESPTVSCLCSPWHFFAFWSFSSHSFQSKGCCFFSLSNSPCYMYTNPPHLFYVHIDFIALILLSYLTLLYTYISHLVCTYQKCVVCVFFELCIHIHWAVRYRSIV